MGFELFCVDGQTDGIRVVVCGRTDRWDLSCSVWTDRQMGFDLFCVDGQTDGN